MIIPPAPKRSEQPLTEERNGPDNSEIVEEPCIFELDHAGGIRLGDDQYIIDPDFAELLQIDSFEDLIRTKR